MGRNKKKAAAVVVESDSSSDDSNSNVEEKELLPAEEVPVVVDDDKPKRKEYKGNKLKRQEEEKKKKNDGLPDAKEAEDDELIITREFPVQVLYCPVCTFPAEMCEFSGIMDKCRPWLLENAAELADAEEKGRKRRILTEKDRLESLLHGGAGRKHVITQCVLVELDDKDKRRQLTVVTGLDLFGFNLKDVSKEWRKKFSAGVGVRTFEEKHEQSRLEIQGNVLARVGDSLKDKFMIPKEAIFLVSKEGAKKVRKPFFD